MNITLIEKNINIKSQRFHFLFNKNKNEVLPFNVIFDLPKKYQTLENVEFNTFDNKIDLIIKSKLNLYQEFNDDIINSILRKYLLDKLNEKNTHNFNLSVNHLYDLNILISQLEKSYFEKNDLSKAIIPKIKKITKEIDIYLNQPLFKNIKFHLENKKLTFSTYSHYRNIIEFQPWYISELETYTEDYIYTELQELTPFILAANIEIKKILMNEFNDFKKSIMFNSYYRSASVLFKNLDDFFKHTKTKELKDYSVNIIHNNIEVSDANRNLNNFIPAGECFFGDRITLNVNNFTTRKKLTKYATEMAFLETIWHEFGHAFDWIRGDENKSIIKLDKYLNTISENPIMHNLLKKCNKIYNKEKRTLDHTIVEYFDYMLKFDINKKNINTTSGELLVESFSYIMLFFLYDLDINKFSKKGKSYYILGVKYFYPVLMFLLKNLKWDFLYDNPDYIRKQVPKIRRTLKLIIKQNK